MPYQIPHRRYNPLSDEWLLVSPHRTQRPWQGQIEPTPGENLPAYDPTCYLCPGNKRAGERQNPPYTETFVFDNDFPALLPDIDVASMQEDGGASSLFRTHPERGTCRVICFSPRHDWTLAHMPIEGIRRVVDVWAAQVLDLQQREWLHYIQIFENKGAIMGCSNPHPHGQLWATEHLPQLVEREDRAQQIYYSSHARTMLSDILAEEERRQERIVWQNAHWMIVVPFWAIWPFETLVIPRRPVRFIYELTDQERDGLAEAISALTIRYDNLFLTSFPYSMGIHQAPVNTPDVDHWRLHLHFYPPLLRSATIKKFMVGYELLASPQRDITAESAAERLRSLAGERYSEK